MRKGIDGLAALAQVLLYYKPFSGDIFVFRGKRGDLVKVLWWSDEGMCLLAKRLEPDRFVWPEAESTSVHLSVPNSRCFSSASIGVDRKGRRFQFFET